MCEKCQKVEEILKEWVGKQGQDRCWYHQDLFEKLVGLFDIDTTADPKLPSRKEFEGGCRRYQDEQYGKSEGRHHSA